MRRSAPLNDTVVFLHIPKSAGTSVSEGLIRSRFKNKAFGLLDRILFGTFNKFDEVHDEIRSKLIHLQDNSIDPNWDLVTGHLSLPTIRRLFPQHSVFTIMREPRSRLISHWLYWRSLDRHELRRLGTFADIVVRSHVPLGVFLADQQVAVQTDNLLVRMLLGKHSLIPTLDFIPRSADRALLSEARNRIASLGFTGLTEDDQLNERIGRFIGENYQLSRSNVTKAPPEDRPVALSNELSADTLTSLYNRSRLDRELWIDAATPLFGNAEAAAEAAFLSTIFRHSANRDNSSYSARGLAGAA